MVEIITQYRAEDGTLFDKREDAEAHERGLEPERLASILHDLLPGEIKRAILSPTDPAMTPIANALERAGYLVAENRRAAGDGGGDGAEV